MARPKLAIRGRFICDGPHGHAQTPGSQGCASLREPLCQGPRGQPAGEPFDRRVGEQGLAKAGRTHVGHIGQKLRLTGLEGGLQGRRQTRQACLAQQAKVALQARGALVGEFLEPAEMGRTLQIDTNRPLHGRQRHRQHLDADGLLHLLAVARDPQSSPVVARGRAGGNVKPQVQASRHPRRPVSWHPDPRADGPVSAPAEWPVDSAVRNASDRSEAHRAARRSR